MPGTSHNTSLDTSQSDFATFGALLRYLRHRARLTQRELGAAVGYSESYINRLEAASRPPMPDVVRARFVEALDLRDEPELARQLIELAQVAREQPSPDPEVARTNLPAQLTRFIGRARELAEVERLLAEYRLVTLVGAGGVGKTRLAQEAAAAVLGCFPDGAWQAELASLANPALVPHTVAGAFRLTVSAAMPPTDLLCAHLAAKHALLLLDNCEHVIEASAALAERLLHACPRLLILATSREPLHINGEVAWRVPPLSPSEAVELFTERAAEVRPEFALDAHNAQMVDEIGQHLDGIPLAIELAASRIDGLSVDQIAERLSDRFGLLTGGSRTALPRHQTLQALIDWSYDLLEERERALFRRLAVFAGGWTAEAAEHVCATPPFAPGKVLPALLSLVNKSMAVVDELGASTRYRLLETLRAYAREVASTEGKASGDDERDLRQRHLLYYADLVQAGLLRIDGGSWHWIWNEDLAAEIDNTRAALAWAAECGDWRAGWRLLTGALGVWTVLGYGDQLIAWLERCILSNPAADEPARIAALTVVARLEFSRGDVAGSTARYREAAARAKALGDQALILEAEGALGFLVPDYAEAEVLLRRAIDRAHRNGLKSWEAALLTWLAARMGIHGDHDAAHGALVDSLRLARETGNPVTLAGALGSMGRLLFERGEWAEARAMLEEAAALNREVGVLGWAIANLEDLAEVGLRLPDAELTRRALSETLPYYHRTHERARTARGLAIAAGLAHLEGDAERAARLLGAAGAILRPACAAGAAPGIFEAELVAEYGRLLPILRAALAPAAFKRLSAEGQRLPLDEAVKLALFK